MITKHIIEKNPQLSVSPEVSDPTKRFGMITSGGVEIEVGEFLYALVRLIKPTYVLETGTYQGLSAAYMGLALKENGRGRMTTIDVGMGGIREARTVIWKNLDLLDIIEFQCISSAQFTPENDIDLLFLDTEPTIRFGEFGKFFDRVVPGGIIIIHDLHPHLSYTPTRPPLNGMKHWPFGDFRPIIGQKILDHSVQTVAFPSPRGLIMFQKCKDTFSATQLLRNELAETV